MNLRSRNPPPRIGISHAELEDSVEAWSTPESYMYPLVEDEVVYNAELYVRLHLDGFAFIDVS